MPYYKVLSLLTIFLIITSDLSYKKVAAEVPTEEISQLENSANYLKAANFKLTVAIDDAKEDTEEWVNNFNNSSFYLSKGQLIRMDVPATDISILFLEDGTYLHNSANSTYDLYKDKMFYPEIILDVEKDSPEILQVYNVFLKQTQWVKYSDYTWESGEPVIVNNNGDVKMLKMWMYLSRTEPIIEKMILVDENNIQHEIKLRYEVISDEEVFEAMNFNLNTASLIN